MANNVTEIAPFHIVIHCDSSHVICRQDLSRVKCIYYPGDTSHSSCAISNVNLQTQFSKVAV